MVGHLSDTILPVADKVVIDGNNLLHAARAIGPSRPPGRERLLRVIEHWAKENHRDVLLVFDGPVPPGPFAGQMQSSVVEVVFSGSRTADDCIAERVAAMAGPDRCAVVSDDTAVQYEARRHRCRTVTTTLFLASLFPPEAKPGLPPAPGPVGDKPAEMSAREREEWLASFDDGDSDEPFDGFDAMNH